MADGMSAPDLDLSLSGYGASGSDAAGAMAGYRDGAPSQGAAAGVAPGSGQAGTAPTEVAGQTGAMPKEEPKLVPVTDLDNLRSNYDRQLAQIQREVQSSQAERKELAQALWQLQTANMTPDQRREAETALQFQNQLQSLVQAATTQQQQMQALEPIFKDQTVKELAAEYAYAGITREELARFSDPEVMVQYCEAIANRAKASQAQQRQPANQAAAGSAGSPAPRDWAKMDMADLVTAAFA